MLRVLTMAMAVTIQPLADAVAKMSDRTPIGAALSSAEWSMVPLALRERAQFSANVESVRLLAAIQDKLEKRLGMVREQVAHGEAGVDRSSFIADIRQMAVDLGVRTTNEKGSGTVRDIRSAKRLGMIFDIQTQQATEYARWKMDQDPDVLDAYPAQRLIRVESRQVPRDWDVRWVDAGESVGWKGAVRTPQVALKSSPIWTALSVFRTPWPPFDFGSGMGTEDVDRAEAEQLGLIAAGERAVPAEAGFNQDLQASVAPDQVSTLKDTFGDQVIEKDGKLQWQGNLIGDLYRKAMTEKNYKADVDLGIATSRAVSVASASGVDVDGWRMKLTADEIRHINSHHGYDTESQRNQKPVGRIDVELIPHVWRDPDSVTKESAPGFFTMRKVVTGKNVVVSWHRSEKNKIVGVKTMWVER